MSNLSELLPAGAGAKSADFVASGTLGSGVTVALNSDGTVEAISGVADNVGNPTAFTSSTWVGGATVYDSVNDKIVVFYYDAATGGYGTSVVGTISGSSISFGTPVVFLSAAIAQEVGATFATTSGKCVVGFQDGSAGSIGNAFVGTVSGTSISFGSKTTFNSGVTSAINLMYDSTSNVVLFSYYDNSNSNYGTSRAATVSGTSLSYGSEVVFKSTSIAQYISQAHDATANRNVIVYQDNANSSYGTAVVATMSGTSISFGTPVVFESAAIDATGCVYDPTAGKVAVFTSTGKGWVGTPSGTTISFGTPVNFEASAVSNPSPVYDSSAQKVLLNYVHSSQTFSRAVDIIGTSISYSDAFLAYASGNTRLSAAYDSAADRTALVVRDVSNSNRGVGISYQYGTSLFADFIGITDQAIADTATGAVIVQGGVASGVTLPYYYSFGTSVVFDTALYTDGLTSTYDSNSNKVVISYSDSGNSGYVTVVVGTVSGSDISFGTPVVAVSTNASWFASTFDSAANKVVVAYRTATDTGEAVVGTVSGTSISFGSAAQFESGRNSYTTATFDSSNNKVVIAYQDNFNSDYGTIVVGTVSGTSISFGTPVVFNSATTYYPALTFDPNEGKVVLGYRDGSNGNAGTALVGTVSGTSISFGSSAVFQSGSTNWIAATFDSNSNKVLFVYNESTAGKVAVGTVSGTSISFGTSVTFDAGNSNQFIATFDSNLNQVFIVYRDQSNSTYGTIIAATISGTTATFSDAEVFAAVTVNVPQIVFDSNANKTVVSYVDTAATGSGTSIVTDLTNTLAIASDYYVQADGTLSTTVSSVPAGRALSSTSILLEG